MDYTGFNPANLDKAKSLRREMTKEERRLWHDFLKTYPIHFYRQRPIERYIVDFYCSAAGLVVELDGDQHGEYAAQEYDRVRTETLEKRALRVLRFANSDVSRGFERVCLAINRAVREGLEQRKDSAGLAVLAELESKWEVDE